MATTALILVREVEKRLRYGAVDDGRIRLQRERAGLVARNGNDRGGHSAQRFEQANNLIAFATIRQYQYGVIRMNHTQVAMQSAGGIEQVRTRAGRIEGADQLFAISADLPTPDTPTRPSACASP